MPTVDVRTAEPGDAAVIVDVTRQGFETRLHPLMIYGCSGAARYVREQIGIGHLGGDTRHFVAAVGDRIVASLELRLMAGAVFLNYISVLPEFRSQGVGKRLLKRGLDIVGGAGADEFRLDVLEHNHAARSWYERLGLRYGGATAWCEARGEARNDVSAARIVGYAQAQACHAAFGFSQFTIVTGDGEHVVGRLGDEWFRLRAEKERLVGPEVTTALGRLDNRRRLLVMTPAENVPAALREEGRVMATTIGMSIGLDALMRSLE